jgi:hypothetical protein
VGSRGDLDLALQQIRQFPADTYKAAVGLFCYPTIFDRRGNPFLEYLTVHFPHYSHSYIFDVAAIGWDLLGAQGFNGLKFSAMLSNTYVVKIFFNVHPVCGLLIESHNLPLQGCINLQAEGRRAQVVSDDVEFDAAVKNAAESGALDWKDAATLQYLHDVVGDELKACAIRPLGKHAQKLLACKPRALRFVFKDIDQKIKEKYKGDNNSESSDSE